MKAPSDRFGRLVTALVHAYDSGRARDLCGRNIALAFCKIGDHARAERLHSIAIACDRLALCWCDFRPELVPC